MEINDIKKTQKSAIIVSSLIGLGIFIYAFSSIMGTSAINNSNMKFIFGVIIAMMILSTVFQVKMLNKANYKNQSFSLFQKALEINPQLFSNAISEKANDKNAILVEIQKFKKVKEQKEIEPNIMDLKVIHTDDSEHQYRVTLENEGTEKKIISLSRYS